MVDRSPSGGDYKAPAEGWKKSIPAPTAKTDLPSWLMDKTVRRWVISKLEEAIHLLIGWRDKLLRVSDPVEEAPEEPPAALVLTEIEEEDVEEKR